MRHVADLAAQRPTCVSGAGRRAAVRHAHRATGQVAALAPMIEGERPFPEVAQQLLAARGSLDSLLVRLVEIELDGCLAARDVRSEVGELMHAAFGRVGSGRRRRTAGTAHRTTRPNRGD